MRDDFTRDEAGAAAHAQLLGAHEHIGSGVGDQEPNPVLDKAAGADPWLPWTCQRCGSIDSGGMPEKCDGCGLRNYGIGADQ